MSKIGQLIDQSVKSVFTGGMADAPKHDMETYAAELSPKQTRTISLLLSGTSISDIARQLKVGRNTIYNWLDRHHSFNVVLEAERKDLWQSARDELMSLSADALRVLRKHLSEDSLQAAVAVIRAAGISDSQMVLAANAARQQELETDSDRIQHRRFRQLVRNLTPNLPPRTDGDGPSEPDGGVETDADA